MQGATHSIYSKVKWTASYYTENIERTSDSDLYGFGETHICKPFRFRLEGSTKAVTGTHPAQAVFKVENAVRLSMVVGHKEDMVGSKLKRGMGTDEVGDMHLYTLETVKPLKLAKGGAEELDVDVEVTIEAPGTLAQQLTRLLPVVFPSPLPRPLHIYNNLGSLISRPADLALKVISRLSKHVSYVWASKDELAIASQYLEQLVKAENLAGGTGRPNGESAFEPVDDDSDDEEETNRRKLEQSNARKAAREAARQAKRRRSDTPEPPEKKQRVDTGVAGEDPVASLNDDITMNDPPVDESAAQQETQPEGRIDTQPRVDPIAEPVPKQQQPVTPSPTIMDITEPGKHTRVIDVPNCAISTLQAVFGFILYRQIVFAPLSLDGKQERSSFIRRSIRKNKDAPIPVSPRSVYRLAKRFELEELASLALADLEKKLSSESAAVIALSRDCFNYPEYQEFVHNLVRKDFRKVRKSVKKPVEAHEKTLFADLVSPLFEDGKIDAALSDIRKNKGGENSDSY